MLRPALLSIALLGIGLAAGADDRQHVATLVEAFCLDCHAGDNAAGGLDLESHDPLAGFGDSGWDTAVAEKVWRRLRARQMPPADAERPSEEAYTQTIAALESLLDEQAAKHPKPGRTEAIRRLTRTEYQNAIRDLLALEIDAKAMLPADESAHGFDNVTVGELSPLLLSRYVSAAERIAAQAIGVGANTPAGVTFRLPADRSQEEHVEGLPLGTRGGGLFKHHFARSGEYEFRVRLTRDRDEQVEGLKEPHKIHVLIDRRLAHEFEVRPPKGSKGYEDDHSKVDSHLQTRIRVEAGERRLGVTFPRKHASLIETKRQPFDASFNRHRHPRRTPALLELSIVGPFEDSTPGETRTRRRVFGEEPLPPADPEQAARRILRRLMRLAYRRPIEEDDLKTPMRFYREGSSAGGFEAGLQAALTSILVSPHFLFRLEATPTGVSAGEPYDVPPTELASRLSFFLWSSLPDDELLSLADSGRLNEPKTLQQQVERMLADERSRSLVTNFASQWLHLRNLEGFHPDMRAFVDFDDNLRQAMRRETELSLEAVIREDRSVLDLIRSDRTYLNERLAIHYGVPGVRGSHFRPVDLPPDSRRGGLLRQGGVLAVTSYATRTSPTIRGFWVLKNVLGVPPPPPPPDVPSLDSAAASVSATVRERLEVHRANPACAACHDLMDPIGLALENYDAVGRWRELEGQSPIDSTGSLPDGTPITGVTDLEEHLLSHPEAFAGTMAEKLLTFALGRGLLPTDMPAVRQAVRRAAADDYRFSSLVLGVVSSDPFLMRAAE
ncbi:hypothetical protein MalM25_23710 [Planctomycetes bacterium MalM25]|nr:hypothetical protein MalM25_23710 [Planctomycetes bacterium MalM25]